MTTKHEPLKRMSVRPYGFGGKSIIRLTTLSWKRIISVPVSPMPTRSWLGNFYPQAPSVARGVPCRQMRWTPAGGVASLRRP